MFQKSSNNVASVNYSWFRHMSSTEGIEMQKNYNEMVSLLERLRICCSVCSTIFTRCPLRLPDKVGGRVTIVSPVLWLDTISIICFNIWLSSVVYLIRCLACKRQIEDLFWHGTISLRITFRFTTARPILTAIVVPTRSLRRKKALCLPNRAIH